MNNNNNEISEASNKRLIYLDILKIIASFAVVIIHVVATNWYKIDARMSTWNVLNVYDSISRWCVPMFVMVTGALLLNPEKEITIKQTFTKYIKRIFILLVFWSIIFALLTKINNQESFTIRYFKDQLVIGNYHLWYLYMLIGLYLITPIIKPIINDKNKKIIEYFLILAFIFQGILDVVVHMEMFNSLKIINERFNMYFVCGYVGYYILGYYLNRYPLKKNIRYVIYVLGIIGALFTILETKKLIIKDFSLNGVMHNYLSAPVCLESIAIFTLIKTIFDKKKDLKHEKIVINISKITLGIYLIHPAFIMFMQKYNIDISNYNLILSVLFFSLVIYILSFIVTYILSKIPIINKYLI